MKSDVATWRSGSRPPIDNPYQNQGDYSRVLCVCTAGLLRSPTLAWVLSNPPYNRNTRAAGSNPSFALIPVTEHLLYWADEIFFVNMANYLEVHKNFPTFTGKKTFILGLPDHFEFRESGLVQAIHQELVRINYE